MNNFVVFLFYFECVRLCFVWFRGRQLTCLGWANHLPADTGPAPAIRPIWVWEIKPDGYRPIMRKAKQLQGDAGRASHRRRLDRVRPALAA